MHYGRAPAITAARVEILNAAHTASPNRFVNKPPEPPKLADAAWINPPLDNLAGTLQPAR